MVNRKFPYTYKPGIMDRCDPTVISGYPIHPDTRVRRAPEYSPAMLPRAFVIIQDEDGNVQSVWKQALVRA